MKKSTGIAVISAAAASLLFTGCGEAKKIEKLFNDGEFKDAVEFYEDSNLSDKEREKVAANMRARLDKVTKDFAAGETSYKTAKKTVEAIIEMDIMSLSDEAATALSKIDEINASKENYKSGKEYEQNGDKLGAYRRYSQVIEEDSNYADAKERADKLIAEYLSDLKKQVEENVNAGNYTTALNLCKNAYRETESEEFQKLFDKTRSDYMESVFKKADEFVAENNYSSAKSLIYDAQYYSGWTDEEKAKISAKYDEIVTAQEYYNYAANRDNYISYAEEFLESGDFERAYSRLDYIVAISEEFSKTDEVYLAELKKVDDTLISYTESIIAPYLEEECYYGAVEVIDLALDIRELDTLKTRREEIAKKSPVYLGLIEGVQISSPAKRLNVNDEKIVSPLGNEYLPSGASFTLSSVDDGWSASSNGKMTFELNGEYTKLKGRLDTIDADIFKIEQTEASLKAEDLVAVMTTRDGQDTGEENDTNPDVENDKSGENNDTNTGSENAENGTEETGEGSGSGAATEDFKEAESVDADGFTSSEKGVFSVYGDDGVLLYRKRVNGATLPSWAEIDVAGVNTLTVEFQCESGTMGVIMYDWTLEK